MSDEQADPLVRQEADRLPVGLLVVIGLVSILIGGGGVLWAWLMLEAEAPPRPLGAVPPAVRGADRPREIGMIDQTLIEAEHYGQRVKAEQRRLLTSYGWVDRKEGIARIPIDRAMDIVVRRGG